MYSIKTGKAVKNDPDTHSSHFSPDYYYSNLCIVSLVKQTDFFHLNICVNLLFFIFC